MLADYAELNITNAGAMSGSDKSEVAVGSSEPNALSLIMLDGNGNTVSHVPREPFGNVHLTCFDSELDEFPSPS